MLWFIPVPIVVNLPLPLKPVRYGRGDIVYVAASDGTVYGINKENGKVVWKHATGAPVFGSVALSGNALVVSDFGGNVYLFCK